MLNMRCAFKDRQPKAFWLGGFTYPSAFLTALLQQFARRNAVPIDTINFEFIAQVILATASHDDNQHAVAEEIKKAVCHKAT